jgi:hypothetical protein
MRQLVLSLLLSAAWATAATLDTSNVSLAISTTGVRPVLVDDQVATGFNGILGDYFVTATLCVEGFCDLNVEEGPYETTDPLTIRLTNVTVTCVLTAGNCGDLTMNGFFVFRLPESGNSPLTVVLQGTGPAGLQLEIDANAFSNDGSSPSGSFTPQAASSGVFNQTISLGNFSWKASGKRTNVKGGLRLFISSLGAGQILSLPDSLNLVFGDVAVPEPATFGLGAGAFALAVWLRSRRS